MKRGAPLKRTPFKRKPLPRHQPTVEREPKPLAKATRRGTYAGSTTGHPVEKERPLQSQAYMRAAKGLGYCMRCFKQVVPHTGGLDFCHADLGKGQGIKTDCRLGWPGCRDCHNVVGRELPREMRRELEKVLGRNTREAILAAGKWPANVPMYEERELRAKEKT